MILGWVFRGVNAGNIAVTGSRMVFGDVVTSVNEINSNMGEVAGATEEQASSVQNITISIHELGNLVEQTAQEAIGSVAPIEDSSSALDQIS
jgi:methyl-accepting chemotaxis protein